MTWSNHCGAWGRGREGREGKEEPKPRRGSGLGPTEPQRAKQKQLLLIDAAGSGLVSGSRKLEGTEGEREGHRGGCDLRSRQPLSVQCSLQTSSIQDGPES